MHITQKLADAEASGKPIFSFEFFPPKTAQGVQNLYDRMDRMHGLGPAFIDITWGAGGRLAQLTCEMVRNAQTVYGLETCMHLTCTDMGKEKIDEALKDAFNAGCTNILALRGDPPRDKEKWEAQDENFRYGKDLVRHIRQKYGKHFDIGVAGYPEGCDDQRDVDLLIDHLKEKIDAGATFVITQMFYDADIFIEWFHKCRRRGINVPIIPGIMPVQTYASFIRRAEWTKCHVPPEWLQALEPVKNNDAAVREIGKTLVAGMCKRLLDVGIFQLHFYTMNLAQSTRMVLEDLGLAPSEGSPVPKPLPWRQSLGLHRREEDVRPIFWRNNHKSYVARTQDWDEFPNGRWGDSRSPAFGELDAYGIGLKGSNEQNIKLWGEPQSIRDISAIFVRYVNKDLERLPWSESPITAEVDKIKGNLLSLNQRGLLTINSQVAVDGIKSSDSVYGWGPAGGYVYQKAYLEVFIHPNVLPRVIARIEQNLDLTYYAVNKAGELKTNTPENSGPNAVTWGVFPGKEIVQPTIVERISFLAWKDEAYRLGEDWAKCHKENSQSRRLIQQFMDDWYLVNIVNNDFHENDPIYAIFDGITLEDSEAETHASSNHLTNGAISNSAQSNGTPMKGSAANGPSPKPLVQGISHPDRTILQN